VEICDFGAETMKLIRKLKRDNNPQCSLLKKDMQMFLQTSAKFLQERSPLNNVFLQNVQCLQPSQRMTAVGNQMITALAACMPQLSTGIALQTTWLRNGVFIRPTLTSQLIGLFLHMEPTYLWTSTGPVF